VAKPLLYLRNIRFMGNRFRRRRRRCASEKALPNQAPADHSLTPSHPPTWTRDQSSSHKVRWRPRRLLRTGHALLPAALESASDYRPFTNRQSSPPQRNTSESAPLKKHDHPSTNYFFKEPFADSKTTYTHSSGADDPVGASLSATFKSGRDGLPRGAGGWKTWDEHHCPHSRETNLNRKDPGPRNGADRSVSSRQQENPAPIRLYGA